MRLAMTEMASPIGRISLMASDDGLCHIGFGPLADEAPALRQWAARRLGAAEADIREGAASDHRILAEAERQLGLYFAQKLRAFDLPLHMAGTPFQLKVWEALRTIPYGETRSYKDIAVMLGQPGAMRAVGGANNRNPVSIIVPCHRVIGANGGMVGYGGGLPIKTLLLDLEREEG